MLLDLNMGYYHIQFSEMQGTYVEFYPHGENTVT